MKIIKLYPTLLFLLISINTYSQKISYIDTIPHEKVNLITDRSIYIVNENIQFSAFLNTIPNISLSKVLYIELVDHRNHQIIGEKFLLNNFRCNGSMKIPSEIPSGIYFIKSYTRLMRNFDPKTFFYSYIKIINPQEFTKPTQNQSENLIDSVFSFDHINKSKLCDIRINKSDFETRDSVKVEFKLNRNCMDSAVYCCISVVPRNISNHQWFTSDFSTRKLENITYYPETRGISLSGLLETEEKDSTLSFERVNLSIIGANNDFMSTYTNKNRQFFFSFPDIEGERDLFLCVDNKTDTKILIDNDFSPDMLNFDLDDFYLTDEEQKAALNLNSNIELSQYFDEKINNQDTVITKSIPFYGKPSTTLYFDQYIQLPTVEDYFNELPFHVKIRKSKGHKYLKIDGSQPEINIYSPLVLIDMVAINDLDLILSIPSQNIKQIDIINKAYIKGDMIYGGVISLISKNNDFGGINLPNSGTFLRYKLVSSSTNNVRQKTLLNIPDTRNTLFWEPSMQLTKNDSKMIKFTTSDTPGEYEIIINIISQQGVVSYQTISFNVK